MADFDPVTGKLVATAPAEAGPAVSVLNPGGQFEQAEQWKVPNLLQMGYQLDTPELRAQLADKEKYGAGALNPALAVGAGLARGLSFGASDVALKESGLATGHDLEQLKEQNPVASTVGELGALAVPVAGELGLAGKAARALGGGEAAIAAAEGLDAAARVAGGGVTGVGKAGGLVEDITKTLLKGMPGKLTGAAARAAVETEAYNIAHNLSEATLGDQDVTAERLLANSGEALALGAGLGFGATAGGMALKAAAEKARGALDGLGGFLRDRLPMASPEGLDAFANDQAAANAAAEGSGELKGALTKPDDIKMMLGDIGTPEGQELRESLGTKDFVSPDARNQINLEFMKAAKEVVSTMRTADRQAYETIRPGEVSRLLADVEPEPAFGQARGLLGVMQEKIAAMRAEPELYAPKWARELEIIASGMERKLGGRDVETAEDAYKLLNSVKQQLDDRIPYGKQAAAIDQDAVRIAKDVRRSVKTALEDESVWGEAGARQAAVNDAKSFYEAAKKRFIGSGNKVGEFGRKTITRDGSVAYELHSKKVNTFLSQTGAARSESATQALNDFYEASHNYLQEIQRSGDNARVTFDKSGLESLIQKAKDIADEAESKLAFESKVRQSARADDIGYNAFPASAGRAVSAVLGHGAVGGAIGGAIHAVEGAASGLKAGVNLAQTALGSEMKPRSTADLVAMAKMLGKLEGIANGTSKRIGKTIGQMLSGAEKASARIGNYAEEGAAYGLTRKVVDNPPDFESKDDAYKHRLDRFAKMNADPIRAALDLAQGFSGMQSTAPGLSSAITTRQAKIVKYLLDQAPKDPLAGKELNPLQSKWRPSGVELASFNRKMEAATNPLVVLDKMKGGTLDTDTVETVKQLYPELYREIGSELMVQAAKLQRQLPYKQQISLSMFFGVPLNPAMGMIADIQRIYAQPPPQNPKPEQGFASSSQIADAAKTQSQRIAR